MTHVDASKPAITWARTNQQLSNLGLSPIRWILDDATKYVKREIRRGVRYGPRYALTCADTLMRYVR